MHLTPLSADPLFDVSLLPDSIYVRNTRVVNRLVSDDEMPTAPLHPPCDRANAVSTVDKKRFPVAVTGDSRDD